MRLKRINVFKQKSDVKRNLKVEFICICKNMDSDRNTNTEIETQ